MNVSTRTLELDPAVTWRPVGTRTKVAPRPALPAIAWPVDVAATEEPAITVPSANPDRGQPEIGDALELGCFVTTLVAIGLLQFGLFAILA